MATKRGWSPAAVVLALALCSCNESFRARAEADAQRIRSLEAQLAELAAKHRAELAALKKPAQDLAPAPGDESTEKSASGPAPEVVLSALSRMLTQLPGTAIIFLTRTETDSHYLSDLSVSGLSSIRLFERDIPMKAFRISTVPNGKGYLDIVWKIYATEIAPGADPEPAGELVLARDMWRFEWRALDGRTLEWDFAWTVKGRPPLRLELNAIFHRHGDESIVYLPLSLDLLEKASPLYRPPR